MLRVPLRVSFSRFGFYSNRRLVSYDVRSQQTSSMFFPHLLETLTFSGVSLKTLLVLTHRRILRPSHLAAWRISVSPNLTTASRNGLQSAFLTSSLRLATAREQQNVGGRFGQTQHCSALFRKCSRMIDRVRYKRSCLSDPSFLVVVTTEYIQERLLLVGGVYSAREQDSSVGGGAGVTCLGVVHMEEGVQDRVQVEVGREEQGEGETHGKGQSEEQTKQTNAQPLIMDGMNMG